MRRWLFIALVTLPFLSKVSLRWLGFPDKLSILWLQGGLHPILNLAASSLLIALASRYLFSDPAPSGKSEKSLLSALTLFCVVLWTQTILQSAFLEQKLSVEFQIAGVALTTLLVFGYGWVVPGLAGPAKLIEILTPLTRILMALSFLALIVSFGTAFKGGRFIGTFKHIPYMVTCSQVALMVEAANLLDPRRRRSVTIAFLALALGGIVLTGTRSAFLCGLFFLAIAYWKYPVRSEISTRAKRLALYIGVVFSVTLGPWAALEISDYLRGQSSFGTRSAQDGVASRMEEVERGWVAFSEEPWLGHGLLNRFQSESLEAAGSYNSFKDPHNIFVSAGVIGGWPLAVFVTLALIPIVIGLVKRLWRQVSNVSQYQQVLIGAFLLSHVPIWIVYHMHLSMGGLADRVYWLFLGYVFRSNPSEDHTDPE